MSQKIPFNDLQLNYSKIKKKINKNINKVLSNSDYILGEEVSKFEKNFSKITKSKYCISCASGNDALLIALKYFNLSKCDEVITTAHTWISSSQTITLAGGTPVFCDTEIDTFNIDPDKLVKKININTKGLIIVHLFGQTCNMSKIMKIAKKYKLWIIEDCAQSHLSKFKKKLAGSFGDMATYSFYPGKNLGAYGDAGAITTNHLKYYKFCSLFSRSGGKNKHFIEGTNSRMDTLQASILNIKLKLLKKFTQQRKNQARIYKKYLKGLKEIELPVKSNNSDHVYHLYVIKAKKRDLLKKFLYKKGISTNINYPSILPLLKAYKRYKYKATDFPNSYSNQFKILSLPIYPELTLKQIKYICDSIKAFYNKNENS